MQKFNAPSLHRFRLIHSSNGLRDGRTKLWWLRRAIAVPAAARHKTYLQIILAEFIFTQYYITQILLVQIISLGCRILLYIFIGTDFSDDVSKNGHRTNLLLRL